jgi:hypothetical protein
MPAPSKIEQRRLRFLELRAESDLLREAFALQCQELEPAAAMAERGYTIATLAWRNRALLSSALKFFSKRKPAPASEPVV